jgi:membrane associated rhomboid family serine protease
VAIPPGQGQDTAPSTSIPTCYRHPGRETYVSCVRCGRPACPECLRSAAVGQQCVECVRQGNQGVRRAGSVFGGRPARGAVVTWTLVAVNIALYLVELADQNIGYDLGMLGLGRFAIGAPLQGVAEGQWYRMITSAFVAPPGFGGLGFLDIAFNMWALIMVGPALEQLLGHWRYSGVYLVSAIGGSAALLILAPGELALGASGAIFGLFGAWFVVSRKLRLDIRWIVTLIVLNLAIGFVGHSYIAWQAHVGGLIAGGLLTAAYAYAPRSNRALTQALATAGVLAIVIIIAVVRVHQLAAGV